MVAWIRLATAGIVLGMTGAANGQQSSDDPYIWLEDVHGERAVEWVKAENQKALATLQSDPRYATFYKSALEALDNKDRIPFVTFRHGELHNFWQDPNHLKGIIRRTTLESYRTASPKWETASPIRVLVKLPGPVPMTSASMSRGRADAWRRSASTSSSSVDGRDVRSPSTSPSSTSALVATSVAVSNARMSTGDFL